jgi:type IV pilus assembly protein PilV
MSVNRRQQGFTLIEILIAIVIFSVGLLGIAGLQIAGMRFTHGSQLRSTAVLQAESMADLMRANEFAVRAGFYNVVNLTGGVMPTAFPTDCAVTVCTAQARATYDLVTWNQTTAGTPRESNAEVLPQGVGVVCRDSTPNDGDSGDWACDDLGNVYAIKLQWQERATGDEDAAGSDVQNQVFILSVLPALDEN